MAGQRDEKEARVQKFSAALGRLMEKANYTELAPMKLRQILSSFHESRLTSQLGTCPRPCVSAQGEDWALYPTWHPPPSPG